MEEEEEGVVSVRDELHAAQTHVVKELRATAPITNHPS